MDNNISENNSDQPCITRPDILDGDKVAQAILPELNAAQETLNLLNRQIEGHHSNVNKRLGEIGNAKFAAVIESMTDGVVMINEAGVVEIANPVARNLLGLSAMSGLSDVQKVLENIGLKHLFESIPCERSKTGREFMAKTSAGKILQMRWNAIIGDNNRSIGTVMTLRDTTAQAELDRTQTEFIASVSHELRTPLTTLQNFISNMLAGVTGKITPKMNQYLSTMQGDCYRLARLINDLLDMAKLEAGKMYISRSATNLTEVATKVVREFSGCAAEKGLSLELNGNGISRVYADSQRIYQVFANLATNAINYTDRGGKIVIGIFEREDEVVGFVEDTGIGIAADKRRHIFNKFYQIARQTGPGYHGSGLGLAISSEIIAAHGGKIWVESEPGKGSKFYFSLPKADPKVILQKHLELLADWANKKGERYAMILVRLDRSNDQPQPEKRAVEAVMNQLMHAGEEIAVRSNDLIIRLNECEAVLVLSQTGKRYLQHVKKSLQNAVCSAISNCDCNCGLILPMLGIALYPSDAATPEALEDKAKNELNRLE